MYKVLKNEALAKDIYLLEIECPLITKSSLPGEFVIVMANKTSEKIPLTIYKYEGDVLSLIYQVVGASTLELTKCKKQVYSVVGPLGNPSILLDKVDLSSVLFVAGGVGIAPVYPQIKYLKEKGVKVDLIYGAKNKETLILLSELEKLVDNLYIATDDGSYGTKGFVTDILKDLPNNYDYCVAIGPIIMMKNVANNTKKMNLKTIVSMNPIMIDGTGMCGACRLVVDGEVKFACVDGPEFDGHKVDFDLAMERLKIYKTVEGQIYLQELEGKSHHGGCGVCNHEEN